MRTYYFDTNALFNCLERQYPPDLFPEVERLLDSMIGKARLWVPRDVYDETSENSPIRQWLDEREQCVIDLDDAVQEALHLVMKACPRLIDPMSTQVRDAADPIVVAFGLAHRGIVVTDERLAAANARPKIPNACALLGVEHVNLLRFLRDERNW